MDQSLFDGLAVGVVLTDLMKSEEYELYQLKDFIQIFKEQGYPNILDDGVWDDLLYVAKKIQKIPTSKNKNEFFNLYQKHCFAWNADGKLETGIFNGTWFQKSVKLPKRKEDSLKRATQFYKKNFSKLKNKVGVKNE